MPPHRPTLKKSLRAIERGFADSESFCIELSTHDAVDDPLAANLALAHGDL